MQPHEARANAKRYVQRLLDGGYTAEDAAAEVCMGAGGPGEGGYEIRAGKIECPMFSRHRFAFAELVKELEREAAEPSLFDLTFPHVGKGN